MTEQAQTMTMCELRDDELFVVAGAKPMEREASRYNSSVGRIARRLITEMNPEVVSVEDVTCTSVAYSDGSVDSICVPR